MVRGKRQLVPLRVRIEHILQQLSLILCFLELLVDEGESVEVHLEKGEVLIFDGDLVHAGAAYVKSNVRVHVYLYACGVPKPNGNTHMVPGFVPVSKVHVLSVDRAAVI